MVFVTGASSGFGRAIAEEALARGHRVVAAVRDPVSVGDLVALAPERVLAVRLDVTKPNEIDAALAAATARFGGVDVLVNNAGFSIIGALEETSEAQLRDVMETMFFGPVALTRAVLDIKMRGEDGFYAFREIRKIDPLVPILFHSAYQDVKNAYEIMNVYKPFAYLTKGGDLGALHRQLELAVDYHRKHVATKTELNDKLKKMSEEVERLRALMKK